MTTPGLAVWIVTVTWFADRSMSMRAIAASRRRERIDERIARPSGRAVELERFSRIAIASSALLPVMRSVTRRALRGESRRNRADALTSTLQDLRKEVHVQDMTNGMSHVSYAPALTFVD